MASMGPRPFGRGNMKPPPCPVDPMQLQWGHDLSVVEMHGTCSFACPPRLLQWGHDLSVVEILPNGPINLAIEASMGPRPFGRGNINGTAADLAAR